MSQYPEGEKGESEGPSTNWGNASTREGGRKNLEEGNAGLTEKG